MGGVVVMVMVVSQRAEAGAAVGGCFVHTLEISHHRYVDELATHGIEDEHGAERSPLSRE